MAVLIGHYALMRDSVIVVNGYPDISNRGSFRSLHSTVHYGALVVFQECDPIIQRSRAHIHHAVPFLLVLHGLFQRDRLPGIGVVLVILIRIPVCSPVYYPEVCEVPCRHRHVVLHVVAQAGQAIVTYTGLFRTVSEVIPVKHRVVEHIGVFDFGMVYVLPLVVRNLVYGVSLSVYCHGIDHVEIIGKPVISAAHPPVRENGGSIEYSCVLSGEWHQPGIYCKVGYPLSEGILQRFQHLHQIFLVVCLKYSPYRNISGVLVVHLRIIIAVFLRVCEYLRDIGLRVAIHVYYLFNLFIREILVQDIYGPVAELPCLLVVLGIQHTLY